MKSLLEEAAAVAREEDAEAAAFSLEAVPMPSDDVRARIAQSILQGQAASRSARPVGLGEGVGPAAETRRAAPPSRHDRLAARPRRSQRRGVVLAGASFLAVAAALVLWVRPPGKTSATDDLALPGYTVTAEGGAKETRGGTPEPATADPTTAMLQRVRAATELVVTLRPDTSVVGPVAARAFVAQGAEVGEARPQVQVAPSGAVQLTFLGAELVALVGSHAGLASVRVVVGRPSSVEAVTPQGVAQASAGPGWRSVTVPVAFEP